MVWARTLVNWFSGGDDQYHNLIHCMRHQTGWIVATVGLDVAVAVGYVLIAFHWRKNERTLPPSPARTALASMRNIFTFCGICGYVFIPVKLVWPAWRLYDGFMLALVFFTWRYAMNVKGLTVLYTAVGRSGQLESDLTAARAEAKRKGAFLNAISHDLRTPLNGLMLQADLAELHLAEVAGQSPAAADVVVASLAQIKSSARLTAELLDRLLEYARVDGAEDRVRPTDVDMTDLADTVLATHAAQAAAAYLDLSASVPAGLTVRTDRLKLERVLNNLVGNAVKYTPAGSVRLTVEMAGDTAQVHVTDTGVGIPAEHLARLFDEFYQIDNDERDRHKGFGLGLAIGRRLARQLGGDLVVTSTAGRGSRFTVTLPSAIGNAGPVVRTSVLAQHGRPPAASSTGDGRAVVAHA